MFAQEVAPNAFKAEIRNVKSRYNESDPISPVLVNVGTHPIFLLTHDGVLEQPILMYEKRSKTWGPLLTDFRCGNEIPGYQELKPGEKLNLQLYWGFAWQHFSA